MVTTTYGISVLAKSLEEFERTSSKNDNSVTLGFNFACNNPAAQTGMDQCLHPLDNPKPGM